MAHHHIICVECYLAQYYDCDVDDDEEDNQQFLW